jgi:hypothetical protein
MLASVGMSNQVIVAGKDHPGAKNRFIYANSRLQKLPTGLGEVARNITRRDPLTLALVQHSPWHASHLHSNRIYTGARRA